MAKQNTNGNSTALEIVSEVFGALTAILIGEQVYFLGTQVAEILGYKNPRKAIIDHVWTEDKKALKFKVCNDSLRSGLWGINDYKDKILVTRYGVLSLIFESKMPKAHEFRKWVLETVIPSLVEDGGYIVGQENLQSDELKALKSRNHSLSEGIRKRDKKIQIQQETIDELRYDLGQERTRVRSLEQSLTEAEYQGYVD